MWNRLLEAERNRVLIQTAGAAAHEINNPLAAIMGQIQLLLTHPLEAHIKEQLQSINLASQRINIIINQMESTRQYSTKPYIKGTDIIDFRGGQDDSASKST